LFLFSLQILSILARISLVRAYELQGRGENLGFSLDPKTDLPQSLHHIDELVAALPKGDRMLPLLKSWGMPANEALALAREVVDHEGMLQVTQVILQGLQAALKNGDSHQREELLLRAARTLPLVRQALSSAQYQSARYDGPLQGTEPAMTMFYTDLLAKLWALDWHQCSPTGVVPGFVSVIDHRNSSASCKGNQGVDNTRIWFGARQESYARDQTASLRLSPNATRLYALGSDLGSEFSKEVEPAANMQRFIGWWDQHYEDVANWEPQYELLNQLVKWTLVRRMTEASGSHSCLSFLDQHQLGPPQRFDRWVAAKNDLRWRGPVPLLDRPDSATESLPLFNSDSFQLCSRSGYLSGGVTLPELSDFAALPVREADSLPFMRRLNSIRPAEPLPAGGGHYESLKLPRGKIDNYNVAVAADGVRSEGRLVSDIMIRENSGYRPSEEGAIRRSKDFLLTNGGNGAEAREVRDGFGVGRLVTADLKSAAPRSEFHAGPQIFGQRLGVETSWHLQAHGGDLRAAAREVAGDLPLMALDDGWVAIGPLPTEEGGEQVYAVMASGGGNHGPPPEGPRYVFGASEPEGGGGHGGRSIELVLVEKEKAQPYFRRHKAVEVPESNPSAREIRELLEQGELEEAQKAAEAEDVLPRSLAAIARDAARKERIDVLEVMTDRLVRHPDAVWEIRRTSSEVSVLRARLARGGEANKASCQRLSACQLRLSIAVDRLPPRDAARELARLGDRLPSVIYADPVLPMGAHLPPIGYAPGRSVGPGEPQVLELIDSAHRLADLPAEIQVGDAKFKLVHGPAPGRVEEQRISPWEGTSAKLPLLSMLAQPGADYVWPLAVVVRCVDRTAGAGTTSLPTSLPDCERPTGQELASPAVAEQAWKTAADLLACDLDGDGSISGPREKECAHTVQKASEGVFRSARL
jgi:hypothetical protein